MTFKASLVTAEQIDPASEEQVRLMVGQLPIVFALREGGELRVPVAEVKATAGYVAELRLDGPDFVFSARAKS